MRIIFVAIFIAEVNTIAVRKFVHQKDLSEHCRRRVVPSVFLGKHVVDANSEILHFSRLQLPYSCSISVRTELGNNIILVIQVPSEKSITESCGPNNEQLIIYELGETFGGYWGAIPDDTLNVKRANYTKYYTLKTTQRSVETSPHTKEKTKKTKQPLKYTQEINRHTDDFIRVDIPLLNVSGNFGLDELTKKHDEDNIFDLIFDVTPRNDVIYDTKMLPLVQFSIEKQKKQNGVGARYNLDYNLGEYTPDSRITFSTLYKKIVSRRYKATRRLNFRRKIKANEKHTSPHQRYYTRLSNTTLPTLEKDVFSILYDSRRDSNITSLTTTMADGNFPSEVTHHDKKAETLEALETIAFKTSHGPNKTESSDSDDEVKVFFTHSVKNSDLELGSLVNRKTFGNVVQAAPVIAVLLNSSIETISRKKRYINSLDIDNALPRNATRESMIRTTEKVYRYSDMQDLAQLVEIQDDDIEGRASLRYLRKYVGSALFKICDHHESKTRQVYLFNASRIVIAISNFTLERMTLVVTPARALLNAVGRCPPAHLECQVAGTRVCIDSTNECDGVPNCGAYDIYDEDRLRCGWSLGLQHNVCLAACTLLAVILTVLYTVHYWLNRCVPIVSKAFFIYTDASENILYLDSIMRTPNDTTDDHSKLFYQANIFDDGVFQETSDTGLCRKILGFLCKCLRRADTTGHELHNEELASVPRKLYSFTEMELCNMVTAVKDAGVQTGSSLVIAKPIKQKALTSNWVTSDAPQKRDESVMSKKLRLKHALEVDDDKGKQTGGSELNLLQLIRGLKISDTDSIKAETEILNTTYENAEPQRTQIRKHLRFDDDVITIPRDDSESDEIDDEAHNDFKPFWRTGKKQRK